jgi:hypothetical protein
MAHNARFIGAAAGWLIMLAASGLGVRPPHAEEACLTTPSGAAPDGQHWYFRTDAAKQLKCWHLGATTEHISGRQATSFPPAEAIPEETIPNEALSNRTSANKPERAQVDQVLHVPSPPNVLRETRTGVSARKITNVPLPKPAPYPKELGGHQAGTSETASVQSTSPQTTAATKVDRTQLRGPNATAGTDSQRAPEAIPAWPDPRQTIDNRTAVSPSPLAPPSAGVDAVAEPPPMGSQAPVPLLSSEMRARSSNSQAPSPSIESPQEEPPSETVAQITDRPKPRVILDVRKPTSTAGLLLHLMRRISALRFTAGAYSKTIAAIVLWTLAVGLLLATVLIHCLVNRILMLVRDRSIAPLKAPRALLVEPHRKPAANLT